LRAGGSQLLPELIRKTTYRRTRIIPNRSTIMGIAKLKPFMIRPAIISFRWPCRSRWVLMANVNPGIDSPRIINPKKGKPQIISLLPLPKGGISMSDRNTRSSVPSAHIPVHRGNIQFHFITRSLGSTPCCLPARARFCVCTCCSLAIRAVQHHNGCAYYFSKTILLMPTL